MAQLTITLPDDLEDEIRKTVRKDGYGSISDFIRDAIKSELSQKPRYWERVITTLVLENNKLLKTMVNETDIEDDELLTAFKNGYTTDYYNVENIASRDELNKDDANFVMDVLEMYGELQRGCEVYKLDDETAKKTLFEGFDGNAGDGYLGYTNFLIDNGRFTYVKPLDKTPHLNSHSPVNAIYSRMLDEYKKIKRTKDPYSHEVLTKKEIKIIIDARVHPENRSNN